MSIVEQLDSLFRESGAGLRREMDRRGPTLAKVTNVTDPEKFNRVKCLPVGSENTEETDWCYVTAAAGGMEYGFFWFPRVDDLVLLDYLDGDPHRPVVIGRLWTTEVKPPYTIADGKVQDYALRTPSGIELLMHDEEEKHKVTLTMPSGATLVLDDEAQKVELRDKESQNALLMDLKEGGITLQAAKKIELSAGKAALTIEEAGNITAKGESKVAVQGANIKAKASAGLTLEGGSQAAVKSNGTLELTASGNTTVKGLMVNIN